ncbi:fatty acid synthase [Arcanobacterium wilhelmae]|uniref:Fatty acid synthase n=1 Tax=Arcanobacterium wilhelmae TaxID=1803177 RepID=A0ABT9NCK6_9ACTO|nr:polyketide synthase [Arcanobacterium wilhelmae]MDP9801458.1 fatty acid synthase [Arcanobacterium wilhelmae]
MESLATQLKNTPYIALFGGQATPWFAALRESASQPVTAHRVSDLMTRSDTLLAPVLGELNQIAGGPLDLLSADTAEPFASVPGILLTQMLAFHELALPMPAVAIGHSQGVLAADFVRGDDDTQLFALARLIGAAATFMTRMAGATPVGERTPMASVRGITEEELRAALAAHPDVDLAIRNGHRFFTVSGRPADLAALEATLASVSAAATARRENKEVGGNPRVAVVEFLPVAAPFHSRLLEAAVAQVEAWARAAGLTIDVERLARAVLTDHIRFDEEMAAACDTGAQWIVDFGPGNALNSITQGLIAGRGVGLANAGTATARDRIVTPGYEWERGADWSDFAPRVASVGGKTVLDTRFSRLTGRSPILLAGMTPTTVEPEIVAAAANAGYWAELAGGGQVTEAIFLEHVRQLEEQLEPGRAVQFNTMFMDPYLWGLHFGRERVVSRERANGAPFDGVVISAGIPPLEEAADVVVQLRASGFPYVTFKPGTVAQIRTVLAIAKEIPDTPVIIQVEDGRAGGHHSWEDMEGLLAPTYGDIRALPNTVLVVGGGLGVPEHAATFLTGTWAEKFGAQRMPVDGILVGTAAMAAKEAHTSPQVKQLLAELPGVEGNDGWVASGSAGQGITSGLSHLLADIHEVDNASAAAGRLILSLQGKPAEREARRGEIIEALARTAKPYFGDVSEMTYEQVLRRYVELAFPWVDIIFTQRFHDMLQRFEARLNPADHGRIDTLFPDVESASDPQAALARLLEAYPNAATTYVTASDAAWFIEECRTYPKPVPFVPAIDDSLLRWWASDNLWQSHDARYSADSVRIIPGPVSVAGITSVDEPVADILARFERVAVDAVGGEATERFTRMAATPAELLATVPHILWHGRLVANPATVVDSYELVETERGADMIIRFDAPAGASHVATSLTVPLILPNAVADGGAAVVDDARLDDTMRELLAQIAGVGAANPMGDVVGELPAVTPVEGAPFGEARYSFTYGKRLGVLHAGVTANTLRGVAPAPVVPSALLGMAWPAIYAAFGSARHGGELVLEGFLGVVHLDHAERLDTRRLREGSRIDVASRALEVEDSASGRVVTVVTELHDAGSHLGTFTDRFAIRGRAEGTAGVSEPSVAGGEWDVIETKRSRLRTLTATAPSSMYAFAQVSGDYNPIHTSHVAANLAGLDAPIVHGMWLDAAAQHAVMGEHGHQILGWTYRMYGMVQLGDIVEITVDRVGRINGGGLMLEVTAKVDGNVVSVASAAVAGPRTAYVYPGQGIQKQGMTLDQRASSAAINAVWERADAHTRASLGFSILAVVRDNPATLTAKGVTYRHPKGVLNLTQFTQVALATVAFAQTEQLRTACAIEAGSYFAGHSLGEYNALCAYGQIMELETVLDIVFYRGSTMHNLVPRNADGSSNYRLGALRPNQFGVSDADVTAYVASVAAASGEFLEIVNYNLMDEQYAVAGTVAGLEALAADAAARAEAAGGRRAFMLIPGIDVPFHSSALRDGVDEFRTLLDSLLPRHISLEALENKYVPNLVARPFALTREFLEAVVAASDSRYVADLLARWESVDVAAERDALTRGVLIELLAYQFASPVRWIETQDLLFRERGIERLVEVGLGESPTLANMAAKTLKKPAFAGCDVEVLNLGRDTARVMNDDVIEPPSQVVEEPEQASEPTPVVEAPSAPAPTAPAPVAPTSSGPVPDVPLTAADALRILLAWENKVTLEQVGDADTLETLTGGVSSKRNQVLMDMSAELQLPSIDGAADMPVSQLAAQVGTLAHSYRPFGQVLSDAVADRLRRLFGAAGVKPTHVADRVASAWELGEGWAAWASAVLLLETREGTSTRGGELATLGTDAPTSAGAVDALIDSAVERVGAIHAVAVAKPQAGGAAGGVVDSAALDAFSAKITDALAANARDLLARLGKLEQRAQTVAEPDTLMETVASELGQKWPEIVEPHFDTAKAVRLSDRFATAREDVARIANGEDVEANFLGTGEAVALQAEFEADRAASDSLRSRLEMIARDARTTEPGELAGKVAVVTGMTPASIAGGVVRELLSRGATVIATASNISTKRLLATRQMYRTSARGGAELWLVPANLASYRDIDALAEWIGAEATETVNGKAQLIKPALTPDLFFPFAAPPVFGTMDAAGPDTEVHARIMLWGVERLLTRLAVIGADWDTEHRMHVVLPGSPNRGLFGGDGGYGEVKAAFDAILNKWRVEPWGKRTTIARARIGWVRGTGLMGGNDPLVAEVERQGVTTFSTEEMAAKLMELANGSARAQALSAPIDADLTGGLGAIDFAALLAAKGAPASSDVPADAPQLAALPNAAEVALPASREGDWAGVTARPEEQIVIVGYGEVGTWGSSRTRLAAELGVQADGTFELTAAGVLELAWGMGLLTWHDTPKAGWYTTDDEWVDESDIYDRYLDEVVARSGIRTLSDRDTIAGQGVNDAATVFLDRAVTFTAANEAEAQAYVAADPQFTSAALVDGEWQVTRLKGATALVPKRTAISRYVAGQMPEGFDPQRWGIPASMLENADLMAAWNLVTAVDAFLSSGFTPAELLAAVHPTQVASTQGTGFGGMESIRKLFLERFRGENIPQDTLQETLANVIAAHTMQAYVGGYGSMIQPVSACATAAVSLEEGVDKIRLGKATFAVTGAIDALSAESLEGFGLMNATASSAAMDAKGINHRFFSRAGDLRRGGFVEAEGGGTVLIARGDLALELGLPVYGVVGYVQSFADGAHTSIPAPGLGALGAGLGGTESALARQLRALGVSAEDVAVVSKHDTSTNANDPNEAELHARLAKAIGRSAGNPLYVISQKTLTGHAKGGAALFQIAGLTQVFASGVIPANRALDNLDPVFEEDDYLVWLRDPLDLGKRRTVKAAMASSLGFGHVSSIVALVHPGAFEASVVKAHGEEALAAWRERSLARRRAGHERIEAGMMGHAPLFEEIEGRHFRGDAHAAEVRMLLDPAARLGKNGYYA